MNSVDTRIKELYLNPMNIDRKRDVKEFSISFLCKKSKNKKWLYKTIDLFYHMVYDNHVINIGGERIG